MSWNENPENPPEQKPTADDPEEYELHGPSDGLEIGRTGEPLSAVPCLLSEAISPDRSLVKTTKTPTRGGPCRVDVVGKCLVQVRKHF